MAKIDKKYEWYILKMVGCVEPILIGPISTEKEAQERLTEYQDDPAECQNSHVTIKVTHGAEIDI